MANNSERFADLVLLPLRHGTSNRSLGALTTNGMPSVLNTIAETVTPFTGMWYTLGVGIQLSENSDLTLEVQSAISMADEPGTAACFSSTPIIQRMGCCLALFACAAIWRAA